jgi:hypothetical protein
MFHEPPAPSQPYTQVPTPSAQSSASLYVDQQTAPSYQNVGAQGASDATVALYPQSGSYAAYNTQSQDNPSSIQTYPSQNQAPASSYSETNSASYQDSRPAYPSSYDPNAYAAHQPQAHPPAGAQYQSQASSNNGGVNYQALLDSLTPTTEALSGDRYGAPSLSAQPSQSQNQAATSSLPAAPNLPPRPPPQDKNATNFNANDDIRSYHPHSQKPTSNQPRGNAQLQPLNVRGGDGHQGSASRSNQSPSTPAYSQRQSVDVQGEIPDDEDSRWPAEVNRLYEEFLEDERRYVTDGQWDQFPNGSRLFIGRIEECRSVPRRCLHISGNLPTEKVTKRDIFHRFFRHGKLAQISIKQAYGFVQFLDAGSCQRALQAEQGQAVRGRKMRKCMVCICFPCPNSYQTLKFRNRSVIRAKMTTIGVAQGADAHAPLTIAAEVQPNRGMAIATLEMGRQCHLETIAGIEMIIAAGPRRRREADVETEAATGVEIGTTGEGGVDPGLHADIGARPQGAIRMISCHSRTGNPTRYPTFKC